LSDKSEGCDCAVIDYNKRLDSSQVYDVAKHVAEAAEQVIVNCGRCGQILRIVPCHVCLAAPAPLIKRQQRIDDKHRRWVTDINAVPKIFFDLRPHARANTGFA
jgi:hypothetical protein